MILSSDEFSINHRKKLITHRILFPIVAITVWRHFKTANVHLVTVILENRRAASFVQEILKLSKRFYE